MLRSRLGLAHLFCGALALAGCLAHEREADDAGFGAPDSPFVTPDSALTADGGTDAAVVEPDAGWCECPPPPSGCHYDGAPCVCSHLTCPGERCGREVCGVGTSCCNSSCSLCTAPGEGCFDIACAPDCSAQDARSDGDCALSVGWAWDGTACSSIACRCVGTDCDAAFPSRDACEAYFGRCATDVDCRTDDARGVGDCRAVLGYAFDARGCLPITGCSCEGTDCAVVSGRSEDACLAIHAMCPILFL